MLTAWKACFGDATADSLVIAVADVQKNPDTIDRLYTLMDPLLRKIARDVVGRDPEDAIQEAKIRIWTKIAKVDLSRPETVKAMLARMATNAMKDEVRKRLRRGRRNTGPLDFNVPERQMDAPHVDFEGVLKLYLEHVEGTGDFAGAHRAVADELGVSVPWASSLFHKAAQLVVEKYGADLRDF